MKNRRVCSNGHIYFKSSDCPVCPVCEEERKPNEGLLSLLASPARRALESKGIQTVQQLSEFTEKEISELHGMGLSSISRLRNALKVAGLSFKKN